jgi:anti-sigma B factor antagonist
MSLTVSVEQVTDSVVVFTLTGRLDAVGQLEVKTAFKERVQRGGTTLFVDLAAVTFIDSSGLAALVSGYKLARERGGTLKLAGMNKQVQSVFALTHLDRVFEISPDIDGLIAQVPKPPQGG